MKKINTLLALLSALLLLGACEKDGEKFYLSSPVESDLIASTNAVVLTEATAKLYALSLAWSDQTLQISDPRYQATSGIQTTVQVSRSEDFSGSIIESTENGVSKSYTVAALNIIAYKLNAPAEEAAPLYFRLAGSNGSNIAPVYSNTVAVTVTPYPIDSITPALSTRVAVKIPVRISIRQMLTDNIADSSGQRLGKAFTYRKQTEQPGIQPNPVE